MIVLAVSLDLLTNEVLGWWDAFHYLLRELIEVFTKIESFGPICHIFIELYIN